MTLLLEHFDTLLAMPADVEHLNRAILTLAVQGKLVEQDPGDEPASELLKRIRSFKGNNAENLHIKDSEKSYKLPKGWEWVRFSDVTINRDGERIPVSKEHRETRDGEYDYYGASGVIDKIDKYLFDKPLLLIGEDGANLVNRSTPIAFIAHGKYWVNNHAHVIDAIEFDILKFLELFINAIDLKPYITGTAQPKMNQAKMNSIVLALPPLAEQKRIVARVETLFAQTRALAEKLARAESELAGLNRSVLAHLLSSDSPEAFNKQWDFIAAHFESLFIYPEHIAPLRQSILELAVRGKLTRRAAGDESARGLLKRIRKEKEEIGKKEVLAPVKESEMPFALPDGWECIRLAEIADIGTGVAKGKKYNPDEKVISLPYLRVANVQRGYLDLEEMKEIEIREDEYERYALQNGDLLLTEGGDADKLGRSAIWHGEVENCIHQNHIFRARPYSELKSEWLMLYTNSPLGRNYFLGASKQTTNLASINKTQLSNCPVPIPPLAEQARIVARVEQLLGLCEALESRLRAAQEERSRLVQSVLAGGTG